ncbi:MAG: hypothetical protein JST51_01595 [Armatimonadetes bacterium]|nr:hypothetical protein [Armatimonadota bacterium]
MAQRQRLTDSGTHDFKWNGHHAQANWGPTKDADGDCFTLYISVIGGTESSNPLIRRAASVDGHFYTTFDKDGFRLWMTRTRDLIDQYAALSIKREEVAA